MRKIVAIAAVAAVSSLLTAAAVVIPASARDGSKSTKAAGPERFLDCLRANGVDPGKGIEVTRVDGRLKVTAGGKTVPSATWRKARAACGHPGPRMGALGGDMPTPAELEQERKAFLEDAAGRLGVSADKLESALTDAAIGRIDAAEKAGKLPAPLADDLRARIREHGVPLGPMPFHGRMHGPGDMAGPGDGMRGPGGTHDSGGMGGMG